MADLDKLASLKENYAAGYQQEQKPVYNFQQPSVKTDQPEVPTKPAFMSEGKDKYGMDWYGGGYKGWIRKTFANIFDPANFDIDPKIKLEYDDKLPAMAEKINQMTGWDDWGEK
jgi:hypothetical protein